MLVVCAALKWFSVDDFFALGVGESAISQGDDADDDENEADNARWFHKLNTASAGYEVDNQHHDGQDQQDVNKSTQRVGANQSEQPEHQQNNEYCPQHSLPPVRV